MDVDVGNMAAVEAAHLVALVDHYRSALERIAGPAAGGSSYLRWQSAAARDALRTAPTKAATS